MRTEIRIMLVALSLALGQVVSAQERTISVKNAGVDSLASFVRRECQVGFYIVNDGRDESTYSVEAPEGAFIRKAMEVLGARGYQASEYHGMWILTRGLPVSSSLPTGYFDRNERKQTNTELAEYVRNQNLVAEFRNKVYDIGEITDASRQKVYVSGHVRDVAGGEPLSGVSVVYAGTNIYTVTDANGFYRILAPTGSGELQFIGYSMDEMNLKVNVRGDGILDVLMKEKVTSLNEVVVTAESMETHRNARMGVERLQVSEIKNVPVAFGEADVLKVVMTLPGVKAAGEASSGFNVRGGSTDQNLILFNGGTIYNPSHMFGLFSAFNSDIINEVELYKSSIPAKYGGRISSVLDISSREGNNQKIKGSLGIGPLTARAHLEGPLAKGRTSFLLGGRMTYSNWIMKLLPENSSYNGGTANFADANLGITHKFSDKRSLQLSGYWSRDRFSFDADTSFRYQNINASLHYRSHFSPQHSLDLAVGYDQYNNSVDGNYKYSEAAAYTLDMHVRQVYAKLDFKSDIGERHTLNYGLNATGYQINQGHMTPYDSKSTVIDDALPLQYGVEPALYVSDSWRVGDRFAMDGGVRLSSFLALNPNKFHIAPELRFSMKYSAADKLTFKAGVNTMNQYIHLISNTTSMSPMDAWQLCTDKIKPQQGWQAAGGVYWTFLDDIDLSVEGYWKQMRNYLDYKSGATLVMNPDLADDLITTRGKAWGAELMLKKPHGKLNGWISYTYSRTFLREMEDRGYETINGGDWYAATCDKPHDVKVVANYKFTHRFSLSCNLDYSTGRPITLPIGSYQALGGTRLLYSERNQYRVPDYFRLDLALNIEPGHDLRKLTHMSFTIGCYNVTGRKNPYSVYYSTNGGANVNGYMLSVFACPVPYANINIKF